MYTILTTFPRSGCGNVGDKLIEEAVKSLVAAVRGDSEFLTIFREDDLTGQLPAINRTRAVLMPAFPIRDLPVWPGVYRLTPRLGDIRVPLIPIGANWNTYPGDYFDRSTVVYSPETAAFLRHTAGPAGVISCREYHLCRILRRHGIANPIMTGDPAWFDLDCLGKPMKRPAVVKKLVFTPPLSAFFEDQAHALLSMLAELFPAAEKYCVFHLADCITNPLAPGERSDNSLAMSPEVAAKNESIRNFARRKDFQVIMGNHELARIAFYRDCDLHVGYECHAHWGFLRQRLPSVLIAEDARGVGFAYTGGVGGFEGFARQEFPAAPLRPRDTSGYCGSREEYRRAPADPNLASRVREFLEDELESAFRRFSGVAAFLDETWEKRMKPFLASLP